MELITIGESEIILQQKGEGKGKIIVSSPYYNSSHFWGAMGSDLKKFLKTIDSSYFADKLCSNTYVFDAKESVKNVRKYIREKLSYELPWYKFMAGQKELRRELKTLERCENEHHFVDALSNLHNSILIMDMDYDEEKKFLEIIENIFKCEPWNFIGETTSPEYNFYIDIHKKLKKKL